MQSIVAQVFRSYAHQRKTINRALLGIDALVGDCLYSMLNEDERDRIVRICYANTGHTVMKQAPELADWEMDWFKNTLPRPPARVLVGGAGWGREVMVLRSLGYNVVGFDPLFTPGDSGDVDGLMTGSYRDMSDAVIKGRPTCLSGIVDEPFDAIILGWTSLSHVTSAVRRLQIIEAADRLCPHGPILGSGWIYTEPQQPVRRSSKRLLINNLAMRIGRLRGREEADNQFIFSPDFGFGVFIERGELEAAASHTKRSLHLNQMPSAHFTLLPTT
ncbi:MAG: hypothetical protein ACON3Z_11075 [Bradymonadia bacterium]